MALLATVKTKSGATVRIHDDCIAPRGSEQERRAIDAQRRAAYEIITAYAEREAKKENGMGKSVQGV